VRSLALAIFLLPSIALAEDAQRGSINGVNADTLKLSVDRVVFDADVDKFFESVRVFYRVENRTGIPLRIGIKESGTNAGPCRVILSTSGLKLFNDELAGLAEKREFRERVIKVVPDHENVSGIINISILSCSAPVAKGTKTIHVNVTLLLGEADNFVVLPLAADAPLIMKGSAGPKPGGSPGPSTTPVSECTGKVLLSDDFKQVDTSWGVSAEVVSVEDGKLKMKADPGGHSGFFYPGRLFKDADYCVTIQSPNNLKEQNDPSLVAGFLFWVQAEAGAVVAYAVMVSPNGRAAVARSENRKWDTLVAFRDVLGMNKGAGAKNAVRVSTSGDSIIA
jgi:hypothetical protein